MKFDELGLAEPLLRAVGAEGYTTPTPIQIMAIPQVLTGRDLLGCAQTGTGKTAAFALPILHRLHHTNGAHARVRPIRALVLSPTRELASQIGESFEAYGRHTHLRGFVIYGGVGQKRQTNALHAGVDILVATPGRLLDLMNQGHVDLRAVEVFVLDEADRMLDMGFIHDIRKIVAKVPKARQTLFFSATMPSDIRKLADSILNNPISVQVAPESAAADNVEQTVYHVKKSNKPVLLAHLLRSQRFTRSLVFTRTKSGANRVVRDLDRAGITSEAIHGNKSQSARERAIDNFKTARTRVLVATDIAARGLDIDDISHVVNYDLPNVPETYVHRIGRTARAGASGIAVSFCDPEERSHLKSIERLIRQTLAVSDGHPEYPKVTAPHHVSDRPQHAPRHQPRRPQPVHAASHGQSGSRSDNGSAPRQDRATHGKPGARQGQSNRGGTARQGRHDQPSRPGSSNGHGPAPKHGAAKGVRRRRRNRRGRSTVSRW
ncbi:MAG TPA: DEAD/DEAH box helicase [Phycisphaerae bacterium]|nr:DEAD/DEAH box helicase [Phycisphaerae bacterium]